MQEKKYIAIDIGGTYVKFAKINHSGNIFELKKSQTPETLVELLALIETIFFESGSSIQGAGISCPGKVDIENGVVYNGGSLPYLHQFPFKQFVEEKFSVPCSVCNDGKAAALSELWLGNLKKIDNGAAIVLGTGVGGGLILDGRMVQGSHFQAGELSFMPRSPMSAQTDNLIGISASAVEFVRHSANLLQLDNPDDGRSVFAAIRKGQSKELQNYFKNYCREIVFIILNLQAVLDISKVVIGGGISVQPVLIDTVREQYDQFREQSKLLHQSFAPVEIEACKFGNEANLLGAIYQLFLQFDESSGQ